MKVRDIMLSIIAFLLMLEVWMLYGVFAELQDIRHYGLHVTTNTVIEEGGP